MQRATNVKHASRWGHIMCRGALMSSSDTPKTINGGAQAAASAARLLRMGESFGARWIVQSVDHDRASQRLVSAAQQTYLATADPAGLCPYVPAGLAQGQQPTWRLSARSEEPVVGKGGGRCG